MVAHSYTVESVFLFRSFRRALHLLRERRPAMQDCVKELQLIMYANMKI
jgi:hypothetical protein